VGKRKKQTTADEKREEKPVFLRVSPVSSTVANKREFREKRVDAHGGEIGKKLPERGDNRNNSITVGAPRTKGETIIITGREPRKIAAGYYLMIIHRKQ